MTGIYNLNLGFSKFTQIMLNPLFPLVIARAIHSLAKIGEDLYLDPNEEGLAIRAANSGKSAFVTYFFKASFFSAYSPKTSIDINDSRSEMNQSSQQYSQTHRNNIAADGEEDSKCRVTIKVDMSN